MSKTTTPPPKPKPKRTSPAELPPGVNALFEPPAGGGRTREGIIVTVAEVCQRWGCTEATVFAHVRSGRLAYIDVSPAGVDWTKRGPKQIAFTLAQVEDFERDRAADSISQRRRNRPRRRPARGRDRADSGARSGR